MRTSGPKSCSYPMHEHVGLIVPRSARGVPDDKPVSVRRQAGVAIIHLGRTLLPGSSDLPGSSGGAGRSSSPIWSCSTWGLPCQPDCSVRGALLPHLFTLASAERYAPRRSVFCGTVPKRQLPPAGRYPAPFVHGARTFLSARLSAFGTERPSGRLTQKGMGASKRRVKARGLHGWAKGCTKGRAAFCLRLRSRRIPRSFRGVDRLVRRRVGGAVQTGVGCRTAQRGICRSVEASVC